MVGISLWVSCSHWACLLTALAPFQCRAGSQSLVSLSFYHLFKLLPMLHTQLTVAKIKKSYPKKFFFFANNRIWSQNALICLFRKMCVKLPWLAPDLVDHIGRSLSLFLGSDMLHRGRKVQRINQSMEETSKILNIFLLLTGTSKFSSTTRPPQRLHPGLSLKVSF